MLQTAGFTSAWVGLSRTNLDEAANGVYTDNGISPIQDAFYFTTGMPVCYTAGWNSGEPNAGSQQGEWYATMTQTGWNDLDDTSLNYFCEYRCVNQD